MDLSWLPNEIMKFIHITDVLIFNCFPRLNKLFDEYIKWHYHKDENKKLKKIANDIKIDILLLYEDPRNIYKYMFNKNYQKICCILKLKKNKKRGACDERYEHTTERTVRKRGRVRARFLKDVFRQ